MQQPSYKPISLHSIMSNIKKQSKNHTKVRSKSNYQSKNFKSEGHSLQIRDDYNDDLKYQEQFVNQMRQHEILCQQLAQIFKITYQSDEQLILHICNYIQQQEKDLQLLRQQEEVNNIVISHYKVLLQQSNEQQLDMKNQILSLDSLQNQVQGCGDINNQNTNLTTFGRDTLNLTQLFKFENTIDEEFYKFVDTTFQFYKKIGGQQVLSFINNQFEHDFLLLQFNVNEINNEIIKVLINKYDFDQDIEQEQTYLGQLKEIRSINQQMQQIDEIGENILKKLNNYKRNEIPRIFLIKSLVNLKKYLLKKR